MKLDRNAALSWSGRRVLAGRVVDQGWTLTPAAEAAGVSVRCARTWVGRYRVEGEAGLADRSSAPRRVDNRTASDRVAVIVALRQLRMTAAEIAETLLMPRSGRRRLHRGRKRQQFTPRRAAEARRGGRPPPPIPATRA
jgi:transposase